MTGTLCSSLPRARLLVGDCHTFSPTSIKNLAILSDHIQHSFRHHFFFFCCSQDQLSLVFFDPPLTSWSALVEGESLSIKMRLPVRIFCGVPLCKSRLFVFLFFSVLGKENELCALQQTLFELFYFFFCVSL